MAPTNGEQQRIDQLKAAFIKDGYTVSQDSFIYNGKIGMRAVSPAAIGGDSNKLKKAYYIEGSPYELGYLMGRLAKDDIHRMAYDFVDNIVFAFLNGDKENDLTKALGALLEEYVLYPAVKKVYSESLPKEIQEEIRGMRDGCGYWCPMTRKNLLERLKVLNLGVDVLCAFIYTLGQDDLSAMEANAKRKWRKKINLDRSSFKIPIFCNAFSLSGKAAGGGHYFGRDFMFPNAGVFQDVATLIVYNPDPGKDQKSLNLPLVSATAPGFAGSMAAINIKGVAAGVDMRPAKNCVDVDLFSAPNNDTQNVGLNSLPMVRSFIQRNDSAEGAVDYIKKATRGVSWIYPIADGANNQACVVEAGAPGFKPLPAQEPTDGCQVRWSYDSDEAKKINKYINDYDQLAKLIQGGSGYTDPLGYVNRNLDQGDKNALEHKCPSVYYFAPLRWTGDPAYNQGETIITTNHYLDPVMRLYSMSEWLSVLSGLMGNVEDDSQWRYDELNHQICDALGVDPNTLKPTKAIDYAMAKQLIEFLAPYPNWPCNKYYNPNGADYKTIQIGGCISIFDLKNKTVETHAGYYGDEWIKITLPNYLP